MSFVLCDPYDSIPSDAIYTCERVYRYSLYPEILHLLPLPLTTISLESLYHLGINLLLWCPMSCVLPDAGAGE